MLNSKEYIKRAASFASPMGMSTPTMWEARPANPAALGSPGGLNSFQEIIAGLFGALSSIPGPRKERDPLFSHDDTIQRALGRQSQLKLKSLDNDPWHPDKYNPTPNTKLRTPRSSFWYEYNKKPPTESQGNLL